MRTFLNWPSSELRTFLNCAHFLTAHFLKCAHYANCAFSELRIFLKCTSHDPRIFWCIQSATGLQATVLIERSLKEFKNGFSKLKVGKIGKRYIWIPKWKRVIKGVVGNSRIINNMDIWSKVGKTLWDCQISYFDLRKFNFRVPILMNIDEDFVVLCWMNRFLPNFFWGGRWCREERGG